MINEKRFRKTTEKQIEKIVNKIKNYITVAPEIAMFLGSGWGEVVASLIENQVVVPYSSIKGMPKCHVVGHSGNFIFGKLAGKNVCVMQGRFHYYEGHDIQDTVILVKIMNALGVKKLVLSNAAGGINESYKPGDIMIINDHINMLYANPLIGNVEDDGTVKFTDMSEPYNKEYISKLKSICAKAGAKCHVGTYLQTSGPNYETPAEVRAFRTLGADAVGMSTVCEVIMARYYGMEVAALSLITNMAAGILPKPLSHAEVVATANECKPKLKEIILNFVANM
ncbi:MAG: purine-nucleoside phosphorylase [Clostridia bacterium]|nr:purine-nucleoside phosphorylase [Clostridia bacterium]